MGGEVVFERLSEAAAAVMRLAQEESRRLCHGYVGTEHILLALASGGDPTASEMLAAAGISSDYVAAEVERLVWRGSWVPTGDIPLTPGAKRVLDLSLSESLQLGHGSVEPGHLLLGLMRYEEGVAAKILQAVGADFGLLREQVIVAHRNPPGKRKVLAIVAGELASIRSLLDLHSRTLPELKDRLERLAARVEALSDNGERDDGETAGPEGDSLRHREQGEHGNAEGN